MKSRSALKIETKIFSQEIGIKTRYCETLNCEIEVKRRGGNNAGSGWEKYCKKCSICRSRAKQEGINPDGISKEALLLKFWFKDTKTEEAHERKQKQNLHQFNTL